MGAQILKSSAIAVLIILCSQWIALGADNDSLPFDIDEWLQYKKHKDFSWDVSVSKPSLTFQQRFLVTINASIGCDRLPSSEKDYDLHFILKVAHEDNTWTPGYSHTRLIVPPGLGKSHEINVIRGVYLRPGRYTLALIVYDSVTQKGNIQHETINVPRPKEDVLPELDRTLKDVEFTREGPLRGYRIYDRYYYVLSYEPLAASREWLLVKNSRRICLDIVANISPGHTNTNVNEFGRDYANPLAILQITSVLSHLGLVNGSIRVSILDVLGVETYFYRENAANFDWRGTGQALLPQNVPVTVDYGELKAQTDASVYLVDTLHKIISEDSCTPDSELPLRVVLVVSGSLKFAKRTPIHQLIPPDPLQNPVPVKVFRFRVDTHYASYDDLGTMLEPAKPQNFHFIDANSFRKALADFIAQLEEF